MIIEHEGMTFEIEKVNTKEDGYRLIERDHKGRVYNFHSTIYTENGINQLMIQRTRFIGTQIPNEKLI
jgi:hypothetical protein